MARARRYHHGDLRSALLRAVGEILREEGLGGVSLRAVARRARVSHAAPAHHFGHKSGLLTAWAAEQCALLAEALLAELRVARPDPVSRLEAVVRAYVRLGTANPQLFELIARDDTLDPDDPAWVRSIAALQSIMTSLAADAAHAEGADPAVLAAAAWSAAHGMTQLVLCERLPLAGGPAQADLLASRVARLLFEHPSA